MTTDSIQADAGGGWPTYKRGNVKLICGDCLDVLPTLGKVDAVVTDPPYGIQFQSNHRQNKRARIQGDDDLSLLRFACDIKVRHSRYVFCRWDCLRHVLVPRSCITWIKNNWSMGDLSHEHARQTELILFWPGDEHEWLGGRPSDVVRANRTRNENHPTEKPVQLMQEIIGWTRGTVHDPFMGSASTGVACVKLGRAFIGIEIDRKYFNIACKRIDEAFNDFGLIDPIPTGVLTEEAKP